MRLFNKNILLALALLAAAQGCDKEPVTPQDTGAPIMLSAAESGTKALLNNGTFNKNGNRIKVYDFVTDGDKTTKHIDSYAGPDVVSNSPLHVQGYTWPFTDEIDGTQADVKQWIPGTHKFFGWLAKDANMSADNTPETFFGTGFTFSEDDKILNIPSKQMMPTTPQFDFLYSNIVTSKPQNAPVQLEFRHLFAAYFISFSNNSPEPLELENVKLNIKSNASATLGYSGASLPTINIAFENTQPTIEKTYNSSVGTGKTIDVLISGNELDSEITSDNYRLTWPQDLKDATIDITFTAKVSIPFYRYNAKGGPYNVYSAEEVTGGSYTWNGSYYVYAGKGMGTHNVFFQHDARGVYEEVIPEATEQEIKRSISLASVTKEGKWQGGNKYNYNLSFSNDDVDMKCVVMRWDSGHGGNITFE